MSKFSSAIEKINNTSVLMEGRNKISSDEIVYKYPDGITVNAFEWIPTDKGGYPVFTFAEDDTKYSLGGSAMTKIVTAWIELFGGDIVGASADLAAEGGCKLKFRKTKTKAGKPYIAVDLAE